jgi:hypothetical protein
VPSIALLRVLVAAIGVGSASGSGPASAGSTSPSVYTDATGDSASAPDLTRVTITPGSGTLVFDLPFSGTLANGGGLGVGIDADRTTQTGRNGLEYLYIANDSSAGHAKWTALSGPTSPTSRRARHSARTT